MIKIILTGFMNQQTARSLEAEKLFQDELFRNHFKFL